MNINIQIYGYRPEFIKQWTGRKRVAHCQFMEGVPEVGGIAYKQRVVRVRHQPYNVRYRNETNAITGIACMPVDEETQSPEAEVTEGGVGYNHVTLRLTPVEEGRWACDVTFCIKESSTTPAKEVSQAALGGCVMC